MAWPSSLFSYLWLDTCTNCLNWTICFLYFKLILNNWTSFSYWIVFLSFTFRKHWAVWYIKQWDTVTTMDANIVDHEIQNNSTLLIDHQRSLPLSSKRYCTHCIQGVTANRKSDEKCVYVWCWELKIIIRTQTVSFPKIWSLYCFHLPDIRKFSFKNLYTHPSARMHWQYFGAERVRIDS